MLNPNTLKPATGAIVYKGKSNVDHQDIVVLAILGSNNSKTGDMIQTYVLVDNGKSPIDNSRLGLDTAICGDCIHKGTPNAVKPKGWADKRSCYVNLIHGPAQVYKSYLKGNYPDISKCDDSLKALCNGRQLRIGTYGDPLAVSDSGLWPKLISGATKHTGYTHMSGIKSDYDFLMYSADTLEAANSAQDKGYRTFRVSAANDMTATEILCPASTEAPTHGKVQCGDCMLCGGASVKAKNIFIPIHGTGKNNFLPLKSI